MGTLYSEKTFRKKWRLIMKIGKTFIVRIAQSFVFCMLLIGQTVPVLAAPSADGPSLPDNDVLIPPPIPANRLISPEQTFSGNLVGMPDLPGYYDTSVYMIGTIAVGLILPESTGALDANTEDWTIEETTQVKNEVREALDFLESQAPPSANLHFILDADAPRVVPTKYEPINHPQTQEGLWIGDTLANMGYPTGGYFWDRSYAYINDLRNQYQTDWAYVIFVADSSNDPNGYFSDGRFFAYSYLSGPFIVMTYDNDSWGIDNMNRVVAHETGHIFLAEDQYIGSGCSKTARSGYLGVMNSWCSDTHPSLMKGDYVLSSDDPARGQLGWRDSDADGILDPLDASPTISLLPNFPVPAGETSLSYIGKVEANPYPHSTLCRKPYCWDKDISLQNVSDIAYQIDGGDWQALSTLDGAFDEQIEEFTLGVGSLVSGDHTITAQGTSGFSRNGGVPATVSAATSVKLLGPGVYDDKHTGWTYGGAWTSYSSLSAFSKSYRYSAKLGNSATFFFVGSKFTLTYETYKTFGYMDIFVDNIKIITLNQLSTAMLWQQKYTSPIFPEGAHMVRLVHANGTRVNVDAIQTYGLPDLDPPAAITNLAASAGPSIGSVNLTWSAPAEDVSLGTGTVASYLVRYSLSPIDAGNWNLASVVTTGIPTPGAPGAPQQMTVTGLVPGVTYYFAVRAQDDEPNLADISNAPVQFKATSPVPMGEGKYDDKDIHWVLKGTWTNLANAKAYSLGVRYTNVINNSAAFVFTGTNFVLGYAVNRAYGGLDVYVDGVYVTTITQMASVVAIHNYTLPTVLTAGQHTVQFIHRSGARVNIDSIQIIP
jgi:hypothetical protein